MESGEIIFNKKDLIRQLKFARADICHGDYRDAFESLTDIIESLGCDNAKYFSYEEELEMVANIRAKMEARKARAPGKVLSFEKKA